jgi:hypothetical protein
VPAPAWQDPIGSAGTSRQRQSDVQGPLVSDTVVFPPLGSPPQHGGGDGGEGSGVMAAAGRGAGEGGGVGEGARAPVPPPLLHRRWHHRRCPTPLRLRHRRETGNHGGSALATGGAGGSGAGNSGAY